MVCMVLLCTLPRLDLKCHRVSGEFCPSQPWPGGAKPGNLELPSFKVPKSADFDSARSGHGQPLRHYERLLRAQGRLPADVQTIDCCLVRPVMIASIVPTRKRPSQLWHALLGHPAPKRTRASHGHVRDGPLGSSPAPRGFSCRACRLAGRVRLSRRPHGGRLPRATIPVPLTRTCKPEARPFRCALAA